jgi:hypothetical protein
LELKRKLLTAVVVSAFFISTLLIFAPSHIFFTNTREFNVSYFELLGYLGVIGLPVLLILSAIITFLPEKRDVHKRAAVLMLSISFLLWLEGNILVWKNGLLTGGKLEYNIYYLIATTVVWISFIIITLKKYLFFYKHARIISYSFLAIQLISISILAFGQPQALNYTRYEIDRTNEFTFSQDKNVIILVLDVFQSDTFQQIIDEDASYKDIFTGFTYFRDSLAGFPNTYASIPNILTGEYYDNSIPFADFLKKAYSSKGSVLQVLKDRNYEVDCFPNTDSIYIYEKAISNSQAATRIEGSTLASIYDTALFRYAPDFLKPFIYNDGLWFFQNIFPRTQVGAGNDDNTDIPTRAPRIVFDEKTLTLSDAAFAHNMMTRSYTIEGKSIFKFYRLDGCHEPFLLNDELGYEKMGTDGYKRQAKASLKIVKIFLDELKGIGAFNNSLIFVIGDHGIMAGAENIQRNAHPLFLVKKFNGVGNMTVSDAPVSLSDITNTIFTELGITDSISGESIFDIKESAIRERRFLYYSNWDGEAAIWNDYLPRMKEYLVSGRIYLRDSWHFTGNEFAHRLADRPPVEWADGFFALEETEEHNWRWSNSEGILIINNTSDRDKKFRVTTKLFTGYPELSNLKIESDLFNENLKISSAGYNYNKEFIVTPGSHTFRFSCDARRVEAPADPRYLVFNMENFRMVEIK